MKHARICVLIAFAAAISPHSRRLASLDAGYEGVRLSFLACLPKVRQAPSPIAALRAIRLLRKSHLQ